MNFKKYWALVLVTIFSIAILVGMSTSVTSSENIKTIKTQEVSQFQQLKPKIEGFSNKKILWDRTHGNEPGKSLDRHSALFNILSLKGYSVDVIDTGILNTDLDQYDILVIDLGTAWNEAYTDEEISAIINFVQDGGGLLVMGDNPSCPNENINSLIEVFGVVCGVAESPSLDVYVSNFTQHPIFSSVSEIYMRKIGGINASAPSELIAWTDEGYGIVAVATYGSGRVVVVGDVNFCENDYINEADNQIFIENLFDWLSFSTITQYSISLGEAVDNTNLTWETGGDALWFGQTTTYVYDGDSAQSGDIDDSENTWMKTVVFGPCTVSFYWKVDSESGYDELKFYIDNVEKDSISGYVNWTYMEYQLGPGTHILKWEYSKDGSVSGGSDCGWVDRVRVHAQCPDADNDGVCDAYDNCPYEPGPHWNCGCPCLGGKGSVDVVFIMDTSGSMDDEFTELCSKISDIITDLQTQGIDVSYTILGITQNRDCTVDYVTNIVPNPISDDLEDWGPAVKDIAENYAWRQGATRVIITMSDEGPNDGCPITQGDYDSIMEAVASARANGVKVFPIVCSREGARGECTNAEFDEIESLAQQLAIGTGGKMFKSTDPQADLSETIIKIIGTSVCDRDNDGVPDGCDPYPDDPCRCGDRNGDGIDDCAVRCPCKPCESIKVRVSINKEVYDCGDVFAYNISVRNNQSSSEKSRIAVVYGLIDPTPKTLIIGTRMPDIYCGDWYNFSADFIIPCDVYSGNYVFFASAVDISSGCGAIDAEPFKVIHLGIFGANITKEKSWENWEKVFGE